MIQKQGVSKDGNALLVFETVFLPFIHIAEDFPLHNGDLGGRDDGAVLHDDAPGGRVELAHNAGHGQIRAALLALVGSEIGDAGGRTAVERIHQTAVPAVEHLDRALVELYLPLNQTLRFADGIGVAGERREGRELKRAVGQRHPWMAARNMMRMVDDVIVFRVVGHKTSAFFSGTRNRLRSFLRRSTDFGDAALPDSACIREVIQRPVSSRRASVAVQHGNKLLTGDVYRRHVGSQRPDEEGLRGDPRSLYRRGGDCHEERRQGADGGLWQFRGQGAPCPRGPQPPYRRVHDLPRLQVAGFQARQGAQRRHTIKQHSIQ